LERAFKVLKGQGQITEINVAETMKEIGKRAAGCRRELQDRQGLHRPGEGQGLGPNVLTSVSPGQLLTKITNDELAELMGGQNAAST
jgi:signal recognition particle subunit SRP54